MALITCPECKKEVSSLAATCPNCGCPIAEESDSGYVKIKFPAQLEGVRDKLFKTRMAGIMGPNISWAGEYGSTARFKVDGPTKISIDMGSDVAFFNATVYPNTSYRVESYVGRWGMINCELVEI